MPTTPALAERLAALARAAAHAAGSGVDSGADSGTAAEVLADRSDGTVVAVGGVVAKAHAPAPAAPAGAGELSVRLAVAAHPRLRGIVLPPLGPRGTPAERTDAVRPLRLNGTGDGDGSADRPATLWPRGATVDPDDPEGVPWETAGALLARLHRIPTAALAGRLPGPIPPMRGPEKAARAMARMRAALAEGSGGPVEPALAEAAGAAEAAWATLPGWCRGEKPEALAAAGTLCHGDFHLGQLVRRPPGEEGSWLLIDVDDLGLGTPAWDLARPAAWYATGLLPEGAWERFLGAYQAGTGTTALDPWPVLDAPARALTVQTAALAVAKAHAARRPLTAAEGACALACGRIAAPRPLQPDETGRRVETQETDR